MADALNMTRLDRGWGYRELGKQYGVDTNQAFLHCLPASDPRHRVPRIEVMRRLFLLFGIRPDEWFDLPSWEAERAAAVTGSAAAANVPPAQQAAA